MLQRLVANWLRQHAQEAITEGLFGQDEASVASPVEASDVVVIFPSGPEAGGFVDKLTDSTTTKCHGFVERRGSLNKTTVTVVEAPVTHDRLARVVQDAIKLLKPEWVLASGFCVALQDGPKRGDMVMASQILDDGGYSLKTGLQLDAQSLPRSVHAGTLLTTTESLAQPPAEAIAAEHQAAIVAEVCRLEKTKMLSVHVVAGHASDRVPVVEQMNKQDSWAGKVGAATGVLFEQPGSLKYLLKDKEHALRLSDRLANFLVGVMEQL